MKLGYEFLTSLSESAPVGVELKYDDRFENIENEINNTNNLFSNKSTDWTFVNNQTATLLENHSKDYRLLNWYSKSAYKLDSSIDNLMATVSLHREFITAFGESGYPQRKRAQISVLSDFINFADKAICSHIDSANQETLASVLECITSLDKCLEESYQDSISNLLPLIKKVKTALKRFESSKNEETRQKELNKTTVLDKAKSVATHLLHIDTIIDNDRDANKVFRQIQDMSRNLTEYRLNQDTGDTRAYKLNRSLTWLNISQAPEGNSEGVTPLKPVPITKIQQYQTLLSEKKYAELLVHIENSLSKSPFWLDGHYISWQCSDHLNKNEAASILCHELSLLLQQSPELLELCFDDGSPFANSDTQSWIAIHATLNSMTEKDVIEEKSDFSLINEWESELEKSKNLLKTNTLSSSIQPLISGYKQASSGRERFFWKFSQIRLLIQARKFDLASTILNELDSQYSRNVLSAWDPELQERLLELWLSCLKQLPNKDQDPILSKTLRERLCCLNPVRVIND
ncbi:MAG: type VI secretion system protein TssA [Aliivibrio sp.]|uniref:type VI secretion system protein TssA n=1 Tax=Aliivibrio sp. TaxID=1872443 RepID=UPI001A51DB09|nr:type VI secretion system protein TssA [Aliivibrio sp.]